ncbi:hypothetical protein Pmani_000650 [Petrolisthes manimaculis]|uniref:Uncharacterized protein n=1 Tax=Petrolisthes manimaculis TaxID=1843537 RepID=A0AAE1TLJ1_9EUCA|nr:hypothetical protein Pmani_037404 [Petrolisthes manimaculis]KAK4328982.1 hypothetical protein Pmani_000650 [Petrolisthes manimaculis]
MINAVDVTQGAEWARSQRIMGSTTSLNTDAELSSHSSQSSSHSVRPKARTGSQRRARVDSQGRKVVGGSISRSRTQPIVKRSSLEVASESE